MQSFHFVSPFRVQLLLWTILIASSSSGNIMGNLSDAGIISSFLEKIIKPFIESKQVIFNQSPKASYESEEGDIKLIDVENAIRVKVIQLEPMLQDSETNINRKQFTETENKIKLRERIESDDETIIIEFVPEKNRRTNKVKSALGETKQDKEKNIKKYKLLRQQIKLLLGKEKTSSSTNKLITKTLDEMLSLLIEGQCKWKSVDTRDIMNLILKNSPKSIDKLTDEELDQYKLTCYMRRRDKDGKPGYNDDLGYSGYSRIKSSRTFGQDTKIRDKNLCASFIVCSEELTNFLKMTHRSLKDTTVSTFKNYAAMYIRDIIGESERFNDDITSVLETLSKSAEITVNQVFVNELENFTLDENKNKIANIENIKNFITATTGNINSNLSQFVDNKLSSLKMKYISTIKDDLIVNLRMDMDHFSQRFADKIFVCSFFVTCNEINGINTHESRGFHKPRAEKDSENVYVKLQMSFDDQLKKSFLRLGEEKLNSWQGDKPFRFAERFLDAFRRQYNNVNVTRTTISSTASTDGMVSSENGLGEQFFK